MYKVLSKFMSKFKMDRMLDGQLVSTILLLAGSYDLQPTNWLLGKCYTCIYEYTCIYIGTCIRLPGLYITTWRKLKSTIELIQ